MPSDIARSRALLTAALGFVLLDTRGKPAPAEVQAVPAGWTTGKASGTSSPGSTIRATG